MGRFTCRPMTFLITGFSWLLLSSLVGLAVLIGLVHGTALPSWLRLVHVHAALIGGILQLMIGGLLASPSTTSQNDRTPSDFHLVGLFVVLNAATVWLLVGFGFANMTIVGVAGVVVIGAVASIATVAWQYAPQSLTQPASFSWLYRFSLIALLGGLAIGVAMAFRFMPEYYAHARLLHLQVILLGFVTMAMIGATHRLLPIILNAELYSPRLARLVMVWLPAGFAILIGGFITSSLYLELAIGGLLVLGIGLYAYNLLRTWVGSGHPGNAASDHILVATFFLVVSILTHHLIRRIGDWRRDGLSIHAGILCPCAASSSACDSAGFRHDGDDRRHASPLPDHLECRTIQPATCSPRDGIASRRLRHLDRWVYHLVPTR